MRRLAIIALAFGFAAPERVEARQIQDPQAAHIAAHVPDPDDFDTFLQRDLRAFLGDRAGERLDFDLLRDRPTQSGLSYPKFYLWVRTGSTSGAMRAAAIDRHHFEVTDFVDRNAILNGEPDLAAIFPAALVGPIRARAAQGE